MTSNATTLLLTLVLSWPIVACGECQTSFAGLPSQEQQRIRTAFATPPAAERRGPYSTPMYYLMAKGYAYEGDWDARPDDRCYEKLKGQVGRDWGTWRLDRNRADWQEAMVADWAALGLNSTHLNIYPPGGKLKIDADWAPAVTDFVTLCEKYGVRVGVRLDAPDETKLWSVHPQNPDSQRTAFLQWVSGVATLLKGRTIYYVVGDELTLKQPAADLPTNAWTPSLYLDYFREVAAAIKRADPTAKVSMFAASSGEWFNVKWLLENGYARVGDAVAINHYDYNSATKFFVDRNRLAPGKLFLASGVGYVSNGTVTARYPEGDAYSAAQSEAEHADQIAKTMFKWWDLGADAAPYYISLRNWRVDGKLYPRWFGFFGFEDYEVANGQLSIKRYPGWYAFQAVALTFYNRDELQMPAFAISSSEPISELKAYQRDTNGGRELLFMLWNDGAEKSIDLRLATREFCYPVRVSLANYNDWQSLDSRVEGKTTTISLKVGASPQIIRLFDLKDP